MCGDEKTMLLPGHLLFSELQWTMAILSVKMATNRVSLMLQTEQTDPLLTGDGVQAW